MEIKEIEGKKYIEYDQHKAIRRKVILNIFFILAIVYASFVMMTTIKELTENKDIIKSDPLVYGMNVHNFTWCQCMDASGQDWQSKDNGFISTRRNPDAPDPAIYDNINFTGSGSS